MCESLDGKVLLLDIDLKNRLMSALLDAPLVNNAFRGTLVEAMLSLVLEPDWDWCSADWASHDFENGKGCKLEVKQSAALQSWHAEGFAPNRGRFDIAVRKIRWEGARRINEVGRYADIYIFAWHAEIDPEFADHRDPAQWRFYAVKADDLPDQKTIGLSRIEMLTEPCSINEVAAKVRYLGA
ncbi:MAG: hypothetical protein CL955_09000 [Erythrobacteraceae bacterium]|nr:hypothetical protein [Erythrobacteraceae bacterium]